MERTKRESECSSCAGVECGAKMDPGSDACASDACAIKPTNTNTAMAQDDRRNHRFDLIRIRAFDPRYRNNRYDAGRKTAVVHFSGRRSCTGESTACWLRIVESGD